MSDTGQKTEQKTELEVAGKLLDTNGKVVSVVYREKTWAEVKPDPEDEKTPCSIYL